MLRKGHLTGMRTLRKSIKNLSPVSLVWAGSRDDFPERNGRRILRIWRSLVVMIAAGRRKKNLRRKRERENKMLSNGGRFVERSVEVKRKNPCQLWGGREVWCGVLLLLGSSEDAC